MSINKLKEILRNLPKYIFDKNFTSYLPLIFANILFLEVDNLEKETVFIYESVYRKYLHALERFTFGKATNEDYKLLDNIHLTTKSTFRESKTKFRLLGLWLWDQYKNPYVKKNRYR